MKVIVLVLIYEIRQLVRLSSTFINIIISNKNSNLLLLFVFLHASLTARFVFCIGNYFKQKIFHVVAYYIAMFSVLFVRFAS